MSAAKGAGWGAVPACLGSHFSQTTVQGEVVFRPCVQPVNKNMFAFLKSCCEPHPGDKLKQFFLSVRSTGLGVTACWPSHSAYLWLSFLIFKMGVRQEVTRVK